VSAIDTTNYNALAGKPLTRAVTTNVPIGATNGTYLIDIATGGDDILTVEIDMTGSAGADLTVDVSPFQADNVTVQQNQIPPVRSDGPDLSGGHLYYVGQWDVQGYDKVRVTVTNKNAAGQTVSRASWRMS
jgi:Tfp pilus tip-associated adhesin PilY1